MADTTTKKPYVHTMAFERLHPMYVAKAEKKGRSRAEVDRIIMWLTGHDEAGLAAALDSDVDVEGFFAAAPAMNPDRELITGVVCGVRVEEVEEPTMRAIRQLDKMVDELARGKPMDKILRQP